MTYKDFMARLAGLWRVDQSEAFPHELDVGGGEPARGVGQHGGPDDGGGAVG